MYSGSSTTSRSIRSTECRDIASDLRVELSGAAACTLVGRLELSRISGVSQARRRCLVTSGKKRMFSEPRLEERMLSSRRHRIPSRSFYMSPTIPLISTIFKAADGRLVVSCCAEAAGSTGRPRRYGDDGEGSIRVLRVMRGVMEPTLIRLTSEEAFETRKTYGCSHRRFHGDIN